MKRKMLIIIIIGISIALLMGKGFAAEKLRPLATDARIKVVAYQKNNVVPIQAATFVNTQIVFGKNESIVDIQSGDPDAWTTNINQYLRNVLNLKPTVLGSNTNLDITTVESSGKRRYYRFELSSHKTSNAPLDAQTYAIQFLYPEAERAQLIAELSRKQLQKKAIVNAAINPKAYHWGYSFHGARSIMPVHIFDDGRFTYLQLRPGQDVPAVFAVNNAKGKESVVNTRRVGDTLVIQQISPQLTLRDGKYAVASIFNNRMIAQIRRYN